MKPEEVKREVSLLVYETPRLILLGPVTANTLGQNGSSADGSGECTQRGGGNDCRNLPKPGCCP
jgi:hypothetical protein